MTLEEMQKRLKVRSLTTREADELREATKSNEFPFEAVGWAFESILVLETAP